MVECGKAGRFHIFSMGDGEMLGLSEYNYALTMRTEQVLDELEDYAGQWSESDFEAELTKRLPGFPSTHFQAHRWPHVGTIVDIRTMGERQEPEKVVTLADVAPVVRRVMVDMLSKESARIRLDRAAVVSEGDRQICARNGHD